MKVLFAVSNEEISESIVKKYQKEYKEIISYKNVYYFNAIIKELQKDKTYDRVIISEELEAFANSQYSQIDKFIFDKLDSISDEASNSKGDDIPIILICSDRREKSDEMIVKLFGIGIYNALLGTDRDIENVCKLLNKPRLKKEAKIYYKIDSEDVTYQSEDENDVSEVEIQNILAHYKRLGKDEKKYVESFDNIASQYNDVQLRIICKFLPLNVRAVLEEKSPKYQEIVSYNNKVSDSLRKVEIKKEETNGTSERLLTVPDNKKIFAEPVVIPTAVNIENNKKLTRAKPQPTSQKIEDIEDEDSTLEQENEEEVKIVEKPSVEAPRRGRGRPRKERPIDEEIDNKPKRGRGRPRKNPVVEEDEELNMMPGLEEDNSATLPGFEENDDVATLPGFEDSKESDYESKKDDAYVMPGVEEQDDEPLLSKLNKIESQPVNTNKVPEFTGMNNVQKVNDLSNIQDVDISRLLTADKKIACFVGTSKNGTSFIVNNLADITSKNGIDTAILDTTKNRNSYYIYTKNEEELRTVAMNSIKNLVNGQAEGIQVNKNLTVYTALPDDEDGIENAGLILETLLKKHSLILIDCDFETPITYFEKTQEIYLVQSYDILTIQPLTAFLRELKSKNVLDEGKLRIILNKALRLRGISDKTIIGGMAYYNDPAMSFMTELFDKNTIKYIVMPFNEEAYTRYLGNVINCEISTKGFPKDIAQVFTELSNVIYPVASGKNTYTPPALNNNTNNGFSASINSTLDEMRKKF